MDPNDTPNTSPLDDDDLDDQDVPMASDGSADPTTDAEDQESDDPMEKDGEEMPQP